MYLKTEKIKEHIKNNDYSDICTEVKLFHLHNEKKFNLGHLIIASCYINAITLAKELGGNYVIGLEKKIEGSDISRLHAWVNFNGKIIDSTSIFIKEKVSKEYENYEELISIPSENLEEYTDKESLMYGLDNSFGPWVLLGKYRIREIYRNNKMPTSFSKFIKSAGIDWNKLN